MPTRSGHLVGKILGPNRVRLQAVVAVGGFGTVYAAETADGQQIAVKILEAPETRRHFDRFRQEFEKLRQSSQHPGIVRCHESGSEVIDGRVYPWYSMEFAAGGDLADRIEDWRDEAAASIPWDRPARRADVIRGFTAIAAAVAHLHGLDIVHRDIKPGNVLIMGDGELRLSDFGLVRSLNPTEASLARKAATSSGAVLGTRHYMAPEQERGQDAEKPADVYALGILLAELATGQRPKADSNAAHGSTAKNCPFVARLPKDLCQLIYHCTDVRAEARPPAADVVLREFTRVVGG